jgi:hypothetical protein
MTMTKVVLKIGQGERKWRSGRRKWEEQKAENERGWDRALSRASEKIEVHRACVSGVSAICVNVYSGDL